MLRACALSARPKPRASMARGGASRRCRPAARQRTAAAHTQILPPPRPAPQSARTTASFTRVHTTRSRHLLQPLPVAQLAPQVPPLEQPQDELVGQGAVHAHPRAPGASLQRRRSKVLVCAGSA